MNSYSQKITKTDRAFYQKDFGAHILGINANRLALAFLIIMLLEAVITVIRLASGGQLVSNNQETTGLLKIALSLIYLGIYLVYRRGKIAGPLFDGLSTAALISLGVLQEILTAIELSHTGTIYNHLYLMIIMAFTMVYPPKRIFPLLIAYTASGFFLLWRLGLVRPIVGDATFVLLVMSAMSLLGSYLMYESNFSSFINAQKLDLASIIDPLTRIYNRRGFERVMKDMTNRYMRREDRVGFAIFDLDKFKKYNDTYGHDAGDACLRQVAGVFQSTLSGSGTDEFYARYGGEEFIIALFGKEDDYVRRLAEEIVAKVAALELIHVANPSGVMTISAGVYCCPKNPDFDVEKNIKHADDNLYKAKDMGGNIVYFSQDAPAASPPRLAVMENK